MKKIMFNDRYGLTEAVLSGRKTQTRRIIKPQPTFNEHCGIVWRGFAHGLSLQFDEIKGSCHNFITTTEYDKSCNRYRAGEVLAVAQPYVKVVSATTTWLTDKWEPKPEFEAGWNNKMFVRADLMPHRIRITNVRVERLQDISDEGCIKEGIYKDESSAYFSGYAFDISKDQYGNVLAKRWYKTPREAYAALIDRIAGKGTWESNPWVFVYDFELVK